ncbi:MAG: SIMPL domain-containing protein [Balneolaceae bacterium]
MNTANERGLIIIGAGILLGMFILGYFFKNAVVRFKEYERTVTVRGLAEQEHMADVVIWPIRFTEASNNLEEIYGLLDGNVSKVTAFLEEAGLREDELTVNTPVVTDRFAQRHGENNYQFRYVASQTVTIYSTDVERVREIMNNMSELGRQGVAITGDDYDNRTEYLFTG